MESHLDPYWLRSTRTRALWLLVIARRGPRPAIGTSIIIRSPICPVKRLKWPPTSCALSYCRANSCDPYMVFRLSIVLNSGKDNRTKGSLTNAATLLEDTLLTFELLS
ncbi:hypothetical protein TTRE_0000310001 [Trichuris trichiura]|uniref:Uncharacterized protein n=1 Tax=Trichuris trichiura TaxID=36087 RepID=A0A077Z812_TRITR|nr:hypothetical protein TTRE_0000310001 [Trichuris trichiura]